MWTEDLALLVCPRSGSPLELADVASKADDGEILSGTLRSAEGVTYPIRDGIPRFVDGDGYNASWDYKWTALDGGAGHNYRIIDPDDPAYATHDLFDRNAHRGVAHHQAAGGVALDFGCGVGQYSVRLLREHAPERLVALDLTRGVDVFRKLLHERFPELARRVLLIQGSALAPPLAPERFDYVFSLGVLMHTGQTREALRNAARLVRPGGHLNVWIYASEPMPYEAREADRRGPRTPLSLLPTQLRYMIVWLWIRLFRRLGRSQTMAILRRFSGRTWYRLSTLPVVGVVPRIVFPSVLHPDDRYRLINNYDGYVNDWSDTWNEHEVVPLLMDEGIVPLGLADWRLGVWGVKDRDFRARHVRD
jgi:SAM-dependent methyltransferase